MKQSNESSMHHQQAWELLPWFINGTASAEERRLVEKHLAQCQDCRAELAWQRQLHAVMMQDQTTPPDPERGLDRLWQRIDNTSVGEVEAATTRAVAASPKYRPAFRYALAAMLVLQVGAFAILGAQFVMPQHTGDATAAYSTLSSHEAGAAHATIRIVPAADMRTGELGALLRQLDLQIVSGPTEAGVYSLAPLLPHGDTDTQLVRLRASANIRFAEPVDVMDRAR
ncbi:MAG: zf-HC2 domain-containing protein [Rhodocyclaceae bacterium]